MVCFCVIQCKGEEGSTIYSHATHTVFASTVITTTVAGEDWQLGNDRVATAY